jgi:hypothetical protein
MLSDAYLSTSGQLLLMTARMHKADLEVVSGGQVDAKLEEYIGIQDVLLRQVCGQNQDLYCRHLDHVLTNKMG